MSWLVWRQYRAQAAVAAALLAGFAAALLVTGTRMASQWHSEMAACAAGGSCAILTSPVGHDLVVLSAAVPAVLGMLWGAPLVAHEIETGTRSFAWTQSVTRARWLTARAGWLLLAAVIWGGAVAALVTWWSGPLNAVNQNAFQPNGFDVQGIAPAGYAVFAIALGIAAGTLLRRTIPAIGVTLGAFIAARLVISQYVRPHYLAAVTAYYNPLSSFSPPGAAWVLAQGVVDGHGQQVAARGSAPEINGVPLNAIPAACRSLLFRNPQSLSKAQVHQAASCMQASGYRGFTSYQPASRLWAFQGIETGIFVLLAAALLAVTFVVLTRRDA